MTDSDRTNGVLTTDRPSRAHPHTKPCGVIEECRAISHVEKFRQRRSDNQRDRKVGDRRVEFSQPSQGQRNVRPLILVVRIGRVGFGSRVRGLVVVRFDSRLGSGTGFVAVPFSRVFSWRMRGLRNLLDWRHLGLFGFWLRVGLVRPSALWTEAGDHPCQRK